MINKIKKIKGYSVVEILVYLAIFTAISILVINSFITILASFNTTNVNRKLLEAGVQSMEKMAREIRQAESIDLSGGTGTLILNTKDSLGNPEVVTFLNENGILKYEKDGQRDPLFQGNITISQLVFNTITTTESQAVKIKLTLLYQDAKNTKEENFYNTIVLRGGY